MSGYLNRVQLIGNLGRDPEARFTQAGKKIVTLGIATSESWKDSHGNRVERTEWHRVVIFSDGLAEIAERYLTKGAKVFIEGKLVTNKWTDDKGVDRYNTEIQIQPYNGTLTFLDSKERANARSAPKHEPEVAAHNRSPAGAPHGQDFDDPIPF